MQITTSARQATVDQADDFSLVIQFETNLNTHSGKRSDTPVRYCVMKGDKEIYGRDAMVQPAADVSNWKDVSDFFDRCA